jgi:chorismate-pyruvate lyase
MNMTKEILKKQNTNTRKNISEVRVEEVHDIEEEKVFWRIYYTIDEKIVILAESLINPQLVRYKSRYL